MGSRERTGTGCSEADSSEVVTLSASCWTGNQENSRFRREGMTDLMTWAPLVKVPVLRRIVSILRVRSRPQRKK